MAKAAFPILAVITAVFIAGAYFLKLSVVLVLLSALLPSLAFVALLSRFIVFPPWHNPPKSLSEGLPTNIIGRAKEWYNGAITDPLHDFGLPFVEFEVKCREFSHTDVEIVLESESQHNDLPDGSCSHHIPSPSPSSPPSKSKALDEFVLRGWHILPADKSHPQAKVCLVFIHGAGRDRRGFMRHLPLFHRRNYALLAFDCREHGLSTGKNRGVGYLTREAVDVRCMAKYARQLGYEKVALVGTSQGGSAAIVSAAHCDPDQTIQAVIAENPFATRSALFRSVVSGVLGPKPGCALSASSASSSASSSPASSPASLSCGSGGCPVSGLLMAPLRMWYQALIAATVKAATLRLGVSADVHPEPLEVVGRLNRPLLVLHGTNDTLIPLKHAYEIFNRAQEPKEIWVAENGEHTGLYNLYPDEWEKRVLNFLAKHGL